MGILALLLIIGGILQFNAVQTFLAGKVSDHYAEKWGIEIQIDRLEVAFFDLVELQQLYIEDQNGDTLIFVEELGIEINQLDLKNNFVQADLYLERPIFRIHRKAEEEAFNYDFLAELFQSEESTNDDFTISVGGVEINSAQFHYHDDHYPDTEGEFNSDHVDVYGLNLLASQLKINGGISATVHQLSLREEDGFDLSNLSCKFEMEGADFKFKELKIQTAATELQTNISFHGDSLADFIDFNEKIVIQSSFQNSLVGFEDISYFAPAIKGITNQVYLDGEINGTVANLRGENIELQLNRETILVGDVDLRGLPEVEETYISLDLEELRTSSAGLEAIPYPPFDEPNHIPIPEDLDRLGKIWFSGNFSGYYNDFVAFGNFECDLGNVKTDIALKEDAQKGFQYKGNLSSESFDIGSLLRIKDLHDLNFDMEVDGAGLSVNELDAKAKGKINSIVYKGYNYRGIELNGDFLRDTYKGEFAMADRNLDFVFDGEIRVNEENPVSKFDLTVNRASLAKLKLFNLEDSLTDLQFKAKLNLEGFGMDQLAGEVQIENIQYQDRQQKHEVKSIRLNSFKSGEMRELLLRSSLLDGEVKGKFKLEEIPSAFAKLMRQYIPNSSEDESTLAAQAFDFSLFFKEIDVLTQIFIPELVIDSATLVYGKFDDSKDSSQLFISSSYLEYGGIALKSFEGDFVLEKDSLQANIQSAALQLFGITKLDQFRLKNDLFEGRNTTAISWQGVNEKAGEARINILSEISSLEQMKVHFSNSYFTINDSIWNISKDNEISIDSTTIAVNQLNVASASQGILIDGIISNDSKEGLDVVLKNINLEYVSALLPEDIISMSGVAKGTARLTDAYNNLSLTSDISIESLVANNIDIGNAFVRSKWNNNKKALEVNANLGEEDEELLIVNGEVFPLEKINSLDLALKLNKFPIALVEPYIKDYLTEIGGTIGGAVRITGLAKKPILKGRMNLTNTAFKVNYLNTNYTINDEIIIEPDFIGFNLIDIYDSNGKKAIATGTVFHSNYSNFNLDIGLEFDEFFTLNTTAENNDLFYGKVISSGWANITGFGNQFIFEMNLKANKGTDFKIPLTEDVDVSSSNFVVFTNSPDYQKTEEKEVDLSGIQLNFDLEILPEAKVQIIFDEQIGDIIKAQGTGNLKLEINTLGNFNIYGQYVVQKGDYLFTLKNIVNKRFDLAKGSRIFWDGDPYKAQIDMQAIYNLRAPLYDLFPEDSTAGFRRRIPVELELQMSNYLMSPDIGFDIRLPTADENTKRKLESILYVNNNDVNRQEMNQQVFGLLLLNRFMPSASAAVAAGGYDRGTAGLNNGYEFLSNQLSNWASNISDQFDVGLNYRPANELNSEELDLSLTTEILNDRLILDGNFGYIGNSAQYVENETRTSNFIGEFSAEYKLSQDGRFRVKGFNRSTQNSLLQFNSPYTQGVGLFYREEFDSMKELWKKYFNSKK